MENLQKSLGLKIKHLRQAKNISQEKFAELIGIATNSLSSIECGKSFLRSQTLEKIVEILEISYVELFNFNEKISVKDLNSEIKRKLKFISNDKSKLTIINTMLDNLIN